MGTATAERTIGIRRPADQVYRFLGDGRTAAQWRSGELEIMGLQPDESVTFRSTAGRVRLDGELTLEAMGEGTFLTARVRAEVPGWRGILLPWLVRSALASEIAALDELRDLLER